MRLGLRGVVVVALALLVVLAGMASSASAVFTQLQVVEKVSVVSSAAKSVTVACPAGKRVVGAGFDVSPNGVSAAVPDVLVDAIRPSADLGSVTARAREDETGTSQDWFVIAYAVCAAPPAGLERVAATSASSSSNKGVVATCPVGKRVLGVGGEVTSANGQVILDGLLPDSALTQVTVNALEDETGNPQAWTVGAYAICASAPVSGLTRVAATRPADSVDGKFVSVSCPVGKSLISPAGTINSPNGQVGFDSLSPGDVGASVGAFEDDTGNSANWGLTAYAICAASAERVSRTGPPWMGSGGAVSQVSCRAGMQTAGFGGEVSGGGVGWMWVRGIGPQGMEAFPTENFTGGVSPRPVAHGLCATPFANAETVTAGVPFDSVSPKSVTATCPAGKRVLGAGGRTTAETQATLDAMRPDSALASVTVTAQEDSTGYDGDWIVIAWAVCAPAPPGLQRVAASSPTDSDDIAAATATCPAGKHLIGTGAEILSGNGRVGLDDVRPDAALTRTTVTATEDETVPLATGWGVTAYSICINR